MNQLNINLMALPLEKPNGPTPENAVLDHTLVGKTKHNTDKRINYGQR